MRALVHVRTRHLPHTPDSVHLSMVAYMLTAPGHAPQIGPGALELGGRIVGVVDVGALFMLFCVVIVPWPVCSIQLS